MSSAHRFLQCTLKICVAAYLAVAAANCLAQDDPASASSAASVAPEKPVYSNRVERDNALLTKAFTAIAKADELQPLETPDEKIIALYKAGETRSPKGALLIMHAPEVPQLWPSNLENLRRNLPLHGWATMAVPLPAKYPATIPERESVSVNVGDAEPDANTESTPPASSAPAEPATAESSAVVADAPKPLVARDKLIGGRVDAAVAHLNKLGQFNIVVLVDNSSAPDALAGLLKKINVGAATNDTANDTANDTIDGPLQALILVNLQSQEPLTKEQLRSIFSAASLPVLDVFFTPDNKSQAELRRLHQAEAMRSNVQDYQQLVLPSQPPVSVDDKQSFWLAKVHGFVAKKAEGSELAGSNSVGRNPVGRNPVGGNPVGSNSPGQNAEQK